MSLRTSHRAIIQKLVSLMDKVVSNEDLASYAIPPLGSRSLDVGACLSNGADNYMERNFPNPPVPCVRGGIYLWMTPQAEYFKSQGVSPRYYQKVVGYPVLPELVLTADSLKNTNFTVVTIQAENTPGDDGYSRPDVLPNDAIYNVSYLIYKPLLPSETTLNDLDVISAQAASVSTDGYLRRLRAVEAAARHTLA